MATDVGGRDEGGGMCQRPRGVCSFCDLSFVSSTETKALVKLDYYSAATQRVVFVIYQVIAAGRNIAIWAVVSVHVLNACITSIHSVPVVSHPSAAIWLLDLLTQYLHVFV